MCGIAGILTFNTNDQIIKSLPKVLDTIKHRGPDDEGYAFFSENAYSVNFGKDTPENVCSSTLPYSPKTDTSEIPTDSFLALGHRRLSIVDLSEQGHQPMCDETSNYWMVFNGEIYNYLELRTELEHEGLSFSSQSDTEVLLKAYIHWGEDCLNRFNGMWSFVIYNKQDNTLFAARDRIGVKPFYYVQNNNYLAFASEIKALLALPGFKKVLNDRAVFDYLAMGKCEVDEESFFKGIFELRPGHSMHIDIASNKSTIKRYYHLTTATNWESFNPEKQKGMNTKLYDKLRKSIAQRLNTDVKVGTCLSGGLDSSIVACMVNESLKDSQSSELQELFTAVYPNSTIDEEKWAQQVAESTQSNWNKTSPSSNDLRSQLADLVYHQDIPFTSTSTFSQYKVMELVAQTNVKTTLDGQGADELFGGYEPHYISSLINSLKVFAFGDYTQNKASNISIKAPLLKHWLLKLFPGWYCKKLLNSQPELTHLNQAFWNENNARIRERLNDFDSNLNKRLAKDYSGTTLKHILRLADRNSMRFSIESRMPFADDIELTEFAFGISGSYKIRNGQTKHLLRRAFERVVPKKIIDRKDKIGFATPQNDWMKDLKEHFKTIIDEQKDDEYVNWSGLQRDFDKLYDLALKGDSQRMWRMINFAIWRKCYQV